MRTSRYGESYVAIANMFSIINEYFYFQCWVYLVKDLKGQFNPCQYSLFLHQ